MADQLTEIAALHGAMTDAERAALLLVARPAVLLKYEDVLIAACARAGFAAGKAFVTETACALKRPMTMGCVWSPGHEAARMALKTIAEGKCGS